VQDESCLFTAACLVHSCKATVLTVTLLCNIIEIRPRAARWTKPLDFTPQMLLTD